MFTASGGDARGVAWGGIQERCVFSCPRDQERPINADDAFKAVIDGKKQVSMFEMTKIASAHVKQFVTSIPGSSGYRTAGNLFALGKVVQPFAPARIFNLASSRA